MAILPSIPGIEVQVYIDGKPAKEHSDEVGLEEKNFENEASKYRAGVTIAKYVESISDKTFALKLSVNSPYDFGIDGEILQFAVLVDGKKVRAPLVLKSKYFKEHGWSKLIEGIRTQEDASVIQKFRFASINISKFGSIAFGDIII